MNEQEIIKGLSSTGKQRVKLYLNEDRINEIFSQQVSAISQLAKSISVDVETSASLLNLLGGGISSTRELEANIAITPEIKAILVEYQSLKSKQLIDISIKKPTPGNLLIHTGKSQIVDWHDKVSASTVDIPANKAKIIQQERTKQERILSHRDDSIKTIVWIAKNKSTVYASIASSYWINNGALASYGRSSLGFLGHYENKNDSVTFLSPLWIWHDW